MKVDGLMKRLRGVDHMSVEDCFLQSPLFGHAADKLEELAAENALLVSNFKTMCTVHEAALAEKDKEIAALRDRNAKHWQELQSIWHQALGHMPRCRQCADEDGRCPNTGFLCDPTEAVIELALKARNAGGKE